MSASTTGQGGRETLSLSVPRELAAELRAAAKRTGIPMSRIGADGLRTRLDELKTWTSAPPRARRERKAPLGPTVNEARQLHGMPPIRDDVIHAMREAYDADVRASRLADERKSTTEVR